MIALFLATALVSNKVVFVDQDGAINAPEVVASVADMTSNRTEIAIAQAAADAAQAAAQEGTNAVAETVQSITEKEFVVYRQGFTDSLGVLVVLPEDTKCRITAYTPNIGTDGAGNAQHRIVYATTADAGAVDPTVKHASTLTGAQEFTALDTEITRTTLATSYEDQDGTIYNYMYAVDFWLPTASQGYFIIYLDADAASGDGMTFNVTGGITGGHTGEIAVGTDTLIYKGGLLMEVRHGN